MLQSITAGLCTVHCLIYQDIFLRTALLDFFYFSTKGGCNPVLRVLYLQGFEPTSNHNLIIGHVNLFNDKGEI